MSTGFNEARRISWEVPQCPFRVEITVGVLNEIRIAVVEGFYSVPRGGVEIGGVFFGDRKADRILIRSYRRIPCAYASGPSFVLSESDQTNLKALLAECEQDPSLAGQERLGWFHSHTRSDIFLSPADLEIYRDFFPGAQEIAMVLRPAQLQPTNAGIFFREADGTVAAEGSYHEFLVDPAFLNSFLPEPETAEAHAPELGAAAEKPRAAGPPFAWFLIFVLIGMTVGTALVAFWPYLHGGVRERLGLEAAELNDEVILRWNRRSPAIQQASDGFLEINDGGQKQGVPLAPRDLQLGVTTYRRRSPRVDFRLVVRQPEKTSIEESVSVSQPGSSPAIPQQN